MILAFCFGADHFKRKPLFLSCAAGISAACMIILVAVNNNMVKYVFLIFSFGLIYATPPLTLTWVPNILAAPAPKRAVAIALVNALGNSASIYGVFLWPKTDAPRYIPGFSATIIFLALISIGAIGANYLFTKYPLEAPDPEAAVRAEIEKQRAAGTIQV